MERNAVTRPSSELEPRQRLEQLLARTDLFARDVLIDPADLQQDRGDLIGFLDRSLVSRPTCCPPVNGEGLPGGCPLRCPMRSP